MEKFNVTIIVVTYNGMSWIDNCLKSCGNYQVIVVDNDSTDETIIFIETHYPNVTLLKQSKNLGFGQGNNIGIRYALNHGAEHVFLLNQDVYLVDAVLNQLIAFQKAHSEYGILSPIHLNGHGNALDYNFKKYILTSKTLIIDDLLLSKNHLPEIFDIDFVNAACWLISRECLKKVGGFNPYFFQYGEDRDYVNRVLYHKYKIGIVSHVFAKHDRKQIDSKKKNEIINRLLMEVKLFDLHSNMSVDQLIHNLRRQMIKCLKKFDFKGLNKRRKLYFYFKKEKIEIIHFKSELKSNRPFLFIKQL